MCNFSCSNQNFAQLDSQFKENIRHCYCGAYSTLWEILQGFHFSVTVKFQAIPYQYAHCYMLQLLNELELHLKSQDVDSSSVEQFKSNWLSISPIVRTFLESHCLLPNDQETTLSMFSSYLTIIITWEACGNQ